MVHPLCLKCLLHCKQEDTVKIVNCPKFQKRFSDDEFRDLIDDLKEMETDISNLKKRADILIQKAKLNKEDLVHEDDYNSDEAFDDQVK